MEIGYIKNSIKTQQQIREQSEEIKKSANSSNVKESSQYSISSKTDSTQLKGGNASFGDKRIAMAKSAMLYEASQDTSAAKLADIKSRIEAGTYHVDSRDIAKSILEA
ncbi:MAG: flagellar biosynthesis anti-sigma factor FlgM [Clostridia bacterium]|nr:flagellar biosynthesis anti-sigma factor FlgM [Clostridia bacterium]